jgi:hypothetical protein
MLSGKDVPPPQLDEFFLREELPLPSAELGELGYPSCEPRSSARIATRFEIIGDCNPCRCAANCIALTGP